MKHSYIKALLKTEAQQQDVVVKGWVRTRRGNKNISFIAVNDGSTIHNIQVVAEIANFSEDVLKLVTTGSCICVKGILVAKVVGKVMVDCSLIERV